MPRVYHVVLVSGAERDVVASGAEVESGALVLRNNGGGAVVSFGPGIWVSCEVGARREEEEPETPEVPEEEGR